MKKKFTDDGVVVKEHKINGKGAVVGLILSDEEEKPATQTPTPTPTPTPAPTGGGMSAALMRGS